MTSRYTSWDEWFLEFKRSAARANTQLELNKDGQSFIDFMDQSPVKRAFKDSVDPTELGKQFAQQFDISTFGKR